ncbi:MAG: hypothetical protein Q9216_006927 [Gyalolechia sp. 2 TL-2023]
MAAAVTSTTHKPTDGRIREVFDSHIHSENTTGLDSAALSRALESAIKKSRAPAIPTRIRSPTLPLDEDADGETSRGTHNKKFKHTYDTAGRKGQVNTTNKVAARRVQKGRSKDRPVFKPVPSRISKRSGLRRRIPESQYVTNDLGEKLGDYQKTRQDELQDPNFTSPTTLPVYQADQPRNLNSQPNTPDQQVRPRRENIALHLETALRATTRSIRASMSKRSTEINVESPTSSMVHKTRWRNPAQKARNSKQENRQRPPPREYKTKSGRVSKRPQRFGFT